MNSLILKLFAMFTMLIDHAKYGLIPANQLTCFLGRLSFPIFAFQVSEGYTHTKNLKKYFLRLFIFALISQFPFMLFLKTANLNPFKLNILFTLILGLYSIYIYDKIPKKIYSIPFIFITCLSAILLNTDYSYYGVLIILFFYIFRNNRLYLSITFTILTIMFYIIRAIPYWSYYIHDNHYIFNCLYTILAIIPILLYNKKSGTKSKILKYSLYFFYPVHLLILSLIIK